MLVIWNSFNDNGLYHLSCMLLNSVYRPSHWWSCRRNQILWWAVVC